MLLAIVIATSACGSDEGGSDGSADGGTECDTNMTTDSGLQYQDSECGQGPEAASGDLVTVHYTGKLENGETFDSSVGGEPFTFPLGVGQAIPGWDEGVQGMSVGGKRTLTIPPELGYGVAGSPPVIPRNATLIFDIEVFEIQPG
ncbi:MAG: FKBP-type peptidyl-prolyl cis-trans isomerase [Actinomycetota bacterium]